MMENGKIEKKFETDDPATGSIGLTLRTSNASDSPDDYNKDSVFEFGYYEGKENYQIFDGTGEDKADSGVAFTDSGVIVTVTITGEDTYDLEIQTAADKNLTKLPGRKFSKPRARSRAWRSSIATAKRPTPSSTRSRWRGKTSSRAELSFA